MLNTFQNVHRKLLQTDKRKEFHNERVFFKRVLHFFKCFTIE